MHVLPQAFPALQTRQHFSAGMQAVWDSATSGARSTSAPAEDGTALSSADSAAPMRTMRERRSTARGYPEPDTKWGFRHLRVWRLGGYLSNGMRNRLSLHSWL